MAGAAGAARAPELASGWTTIISHVAIDDTSRVAYVAAMPDERAATTIEFIGQAVASGRCRP